MNRFSRFSHYYKPYAFLFYADLFCAFIVGSVDLIFPMIVRFMVDNVLGVKAHIQTDLILKIGAGMLVMFIIQYFANYFITAWGHIMGARMEYDMRNDIFTHLQKLTFSYFDNTKTGQIMSRIVNDLFDISELAHHGPEEIFLSLLKIIGSFIILLMIDVKLTLIIFAFVPVMMAFSFYYNKKMRATFKLNRQKIADVNAQIEDSIAGIRVVQSFSNEDMEYCKFEDGNKKFLVTKEDNYFYMGRFFGGVTLFQGIIYVATVVAGTYFINEGSIRPGDLVAYLLYINTFLTPIRTLLNFTEQFQKGMTGFERFLEILDTQPEIADTPHSTDFVQVKGDIEFENVSFKYDNDAQVLNNISLSVNSGKTVALVGPSGGGKTTLCSLIPRFYEVTEGSIRIDGIDIRNIKLASLRKNIGMVQQDVYLFAGTVKENIGYGKMDASEEEIIASAKQANAHDFIMELENGYETYVGERGVKLSGGQKQRISIARAFLKNPPILILDEATSSLDTKSEKIIQESLDALSKSRTTLVIAHRLSTIRNADMILVVGDSGIEESGTHEELMKNKGTYAELYEQQFEDSIDSNDLNDDIKEIF